MHAMSYIYLSRFLQSSISGICSWKRCIKGTYVFCACIERSNNKDIVYQAQRNARHNAQRCDGRYKEFLKCTMLLWACKIRSRGTYSVFYKGKCTKRNGEECMYTVLQIYICLLFFFLKLVDKTQCH